MTGTTIMAVEFDGGVVMGADSRTSSGNYVANRVSDKISPLADNIYICRSGSAADTQAISEMVRHYVSSHSIEVGRMPEVKAAANLVKMIAYNNKSQLMAGMIVAGWDPRHGGSVYNIPLGGAMLRQPFCIGGSGSTYIYGHCDATFREGMSRKECQDFVFKAVTLAMARDGSSGGVVRLCTIDKNGVERSFFPGNKLPLYHDEIGEPGILDSQRGRPVSQERMAAMQ